MGSAGLHQQSTSAPVPSMCLSSFAGGSENGERELERPGEARGREATGRGEAGEGWREGDRSSGDKHSGQAEAMPDFETPGVRHERRSRQSEL